MGGNKTVETLAEVPAPSPDDELRCPLCEYSLRGLTEPRCPECGHRSSWNELRAQQPIHSYLFERHPKRNVWSFARTVLASIRPRKFWRGLSPTLAPVPKRIFLYTVILMLLAAVAGVGSIAVDLSDWAKGNGFSRQQLEYQLASASNRQSVYYDPQLARRVAAIKASGDTIQGYARRQYPAMSDLAFWRRALQGQYWRGYGMRAAQIGLTIASWPLVALVSLLIFRASLRQAKIHTIHVVRVVAYSASVLAFAAPALVLFAWFLPALPVPYAVWWMVPFPITGGLYFAVLLFVSLTYRLGVAYALYLRFDHPYLTAIASQAIVLLTLWKIAFVAMGN